MSPWELEHEQETSFEGRESQRTKLMKIMLKIYIKRYQKTLVKPQKLQGGELYYKGKRKPLTTKGVLKSVGMLADILGKGGLRNLGFDIPMEKVTARQVVMLNKAAEELPSESDITGADDIELQEIAEKHQT